MIAQNQRIKYILQENVTNQDIVRINKTPKVLWIFNFFLYVINATYVPVCCKNLWLPLNSSTKEIPLSF